MPESDRKAPADWAAGEGLPGWPAGGRACGADAKKRKEAPVVRAQWEMGGQRGPQRPGHQP